MYFPFEKTSSTADRLYAHTADIPTSFLLIQEEIREKNKTQQNIGAIIIFL